MKQAIVFVTLVLCYVLQTSFFAALPFHVIPDLVLIFLVLLVLRTGKKAWKWGFVAGLLLDLLGGKYMGVAVFVFTVVAYLAGVVQAYFYEGNPFLPPLIVAAATFFKHLLWIIAMPIVGGAILSFNSFLLLTVAESIYNITLYYILSYLFNQAKKQFVTTDEIL